MGGAGEPSDKQEWQLPDMGQVRLAAGRAWELGASISEYLWRAPPLHYFESNGETIHFHEAGEGPPVVLLHGLSVPSEMSWFASGIAHRLAANYHVYTMDFRGHGKSARPHQPEGYGMELVHDVVRMLDHEEIEHAHVAGYSLGGLVALRALIDYPDRFRSGVLCASGWRQPGAELRQSLHEMGQALTAGKGDESVRDALTCDEVDMATLFSGFLVNVIDMWNDRAALGALLQSMITLFPDESNVRNCHVPTLGICGNADMVYGDAQRLCQLKPNHRFAMLDNDSHFTSLLNERLVEALEQFIGEQEQNRQAGPAQENATQRR